MLSRFLKAATIGLALIATPGAAQSVDPLGRLFPASAGFSAEIGKDVAANDTRTYSGVNIRGQGRVITIDEITFGVTNTVQVAVQMRNVTIRPTDPTAPIILLSGLRMQLADWPIYQEGACGLPGAIRNVDLNGMEVRFMHEADPIRTIRLRGGKFEHRKVVDACWIGGLFSIQDAEVDLRNDTSFTATGLRAEISMPQREASAAAAPVKTSSVRAEIQEIELRNTGNTPAFGFGTVSLKADFDTASLAGIHKVLASSHLNGSRANGQLNIMQGLNGLSLITSDIQIAAPITRIYSAGVVPPEAVTNFSRVGLSTVTGESSYRIRSRAGTVGLDIDLGLIGLIDATFDARFEIRPYAMQKLQAAASGLELGAHLIPDIALLGANLRYEDRGFEGYVVDLTGVPSGRYIEEFGAVIGAAGSNRIDGSIRGISQGLSEFFRYAASGFIMTVKAEPPARVNIAKASLLALTDMNGLIEALGLQQGRSRPSDQN